MKTILVPSTGKYSDASALETAYVAGRLFESHIECLHLRTSAASIARAALTPQMDGAGLSVEAIEVLTQEEAETAKTAHAAFRAFCRHKSIPILTNPGARGISASYREKEGDRLGLIAGAARYHDLVVLSQTNIDGGFSLGDIASIILGSGRPVLLSPVNPPENLAPTIAIAWKDTPEAARAMTAAMPFLERAEKIILLAGNEGEDMPVLMENAQCAADYLRWHGFTVEVQCLVSGNRPLTHALLSAAREVNADMMVMGAYGHSRLRETLLGGLTRSVLKGFELPVLLFH